MRKGTVYQACTGTYYGEIDLWERFESGEWSPCCWDDSGREWVETDSGELLVLTPIRQQELPAFVDVERRCGGVCIVPSDS